VTEHEEIQALAARKPPAKFELVVNRGTGTIDSPTLEVSWRFPAEVIALRPTHVLIFLWYMSDDGQKMYREERYAFSVSDAVGYLPLHWAGLIRIFAWALSDEALQCEYCLNHCIGKTVTNLIKQANIRGNYAAFAWNLPENQLRGTQENLLGEAGYYTHVSEEGIRSWQRPYDQRNSFHMQNHFPLAAIAELKLRVPAEIFAPRPKSWLSRILWKWVNLWHDQEPVDECAYRRRMMIAFTVQPLVMLVYWTIRYGFGLLVALIIMTLRIVAWAAGFQPHPFIADVVEMILVKDNHHDFWQRFKNTSDPWDFFNCGDHRKLRLGSWRFKAPVTIAELALVGSVAYLLAHPELNTTPSAWGAGFDFLFGISVLVFMGAVWAHRALKTLFPEHEWFKKSTPPPKPKTAEERAAHERREAERKAQIEQKEKEAYAAWLAKNCGPHAPGPRPMGLPRPKPREATLTNYAWLIYNGLKAHICRTYDRGNKS
jgi:hypothetical protein